MKIVHLSDLHLGKRVNEFSMLEDQEYILSKIIEVIDGERPEAVVVAGDVYDKSVPPAEAVRLFDDFLVRLAQRGLQVFIVSGNHDSAERLAFGSRLMESSGVRLAPVYDGNAESVTLEDEYGPVCFYMLPFVRPAAVRAILGDEEIQSCDGAVRAAVSRMAPDPSARNVLVTHQFVTGAAVSESEDASVGVLDSVDVSAFEPFDYVALGHIHGPQWVGRETVRYSGSPLKYSFSEKDQEKSVTVAELGPKGSVKTRTVPLTPLRELREIRGTYAELTLRENYQGTAVEDYLRAVLTDEEDVPDAMGRLRAVYPNLMKLDYDNTRTAAAAFTAAAQVRGRNGEELLLELYEKQNGRPMNGEQLSYARQLFKRLKEAEE